MSVKTRRQTTSHINSQDNHAIIYIINKNKYTGKDTFTLTLTSRECRHYATIDIISTSRMILIEDERKKMPANEQAIDNIVNNKIFLFMWVFVLMFNVFLYYIQTERNRDDIRFSTPHRPHLQRWNWWNLWVSKWIVAACGLQSKQMDISEHKNVITNVLFTRLHGIFHWIYWKYAIDALFSVLLPWLRLISWMPNYNRFFKIYSMIIFLLTLFAQPDFTRAEQTIFRDVVVFSVVNEISVT